MIQPISSSYQDSTVNGSHFDKYHHRLIIISILPQDGAH